MTNQAYFGGYDGDVFDDPVAVTISNRHPEDMLRTVAAGVPVHTAVVGNKSVGLEEFEDESATDVLALGSIYEEITGESVYLAMSAPEFHAALAGKTGGRLPDRVVEAFSNRFNEALERADSAASEVLIYPYETSAHLQERRDEDDYHWIAPDDAAREAIESKTKFYDQLQAAGVRTVPGGVARSVEEARTLLGAHDQGEGVFIGLEVGSGGIGSAHVRTTDEIEDLMDDSDEALVTQWVDHDKIGGTPNVQLLVGASSVTVFAASDQVIEGETGWRGNAAYNGMSEAKKKSMIKTCQEIGTVLTEAFGDLGIVAVDGMFYEERFYPIEVNPRKNGSTAMKLAQLEPRRDGPPLIAQEAEVLAGSRDEIVDDSDPVADVGSGWEMYILMNPDFAGDHTVPSELVGTEADWPDQDQILTNVVPESVPPSPEIRPETAPGESYVELAKVITTGGEARADVIDRLRGQ